MIRLVVSKVVSPVVEGSSELLEDSLLRLSDKLCCSEVIEDDEVRLSEEG